MSRHALDLVLPPEPKFIFDLSATGRLSGSRPAATIDGPFGDGSFESDAVDGDDEIDGAATVPAGPASPLGDAAPVLGDGDGWVVVVVVRVGASPSGPGPVPGRRAGHFVEQRS